MDDILISERLSDTLNQHDFRVELVSNEGSIMNLIIVSVVRNLFLIYTFVLFYIQLIYLSL